MSTDKITTDEWLAELERLQAELARGDDGMTTQEIMAIMDIPPGRGGELNVRVKLRAWIAAGRVVAGRAPRRTISGKMTTVPVYRFVKQAKP